MQVAKIEAGAFGGRLTAGAFAFDVRHPEPTVKLSVTGAQLDQLLRLFKDVPAEASGPVDGELPVSWREGQLRLGTGFFQLSVGEFGRVHFTRDLHLLTSGRRPGTPEYDSLRKVEQAIMDLHFNRLRIDTYPSDAPGQTLRLRLVGSPVGEGVATPVNLDVNVNAPLEHFLNWRRPAGAGR